MQSNRVICWKKKRYFRGQNSFWIAEFWKVQGDPLARVLRKRFKHEGQYPERKFLCVYSDEMVEPQGEGKGSLVHITAIFGFMLAGLVIQDAVRSH